MRDKLITGGMRLRLKRPLGILVPGKAIIGALGTSKQPLISVGDIVTLLLLEAGLIPDVCFVDFRCRRKAISEGKERRLRNFRAAEIKVRNPPGMISAELMRACRKIFGGKRKFPVKVLVEGEEDLAVLAAAIYAPAGSRIIYGQPGEGAVLVMVTDRARKNAEWYYANALGMGREGNAGTASNASNR